MNAEAEQYIALHPLESTSDILHKDKELELQKKLYSSVEEKTNWSLTHPADLSQQLEVTYCVTILPES